MRRGRRAWSGAQRDARLAAGRGGEGGASYLQGLVVCLARGGGGSGVRISDFTRQEMGIQGE